ncbi:hypothetical protein THAOC_32210, partial [Thalassiosira oceanica]
GCPPGVGVDGLLRHPYAVESSLRYNMIEQIEQTTRAEAASGPDGDDNGPGSELPPHDRFQCIGAVCLDLVGEDGFLPYRLALATILAVKRTSPQIESVSNLQLRSRDQKSLKCIVAPIIASARSEPAFAPRRRRLYAAPDDMLVLATKSNHNLL